MSEDDEDLARLRAEMDQAREAMRETAANLAAFHKGLMENGFKRGEAFALTSYMLTSMMKGSQGGEQQ